MKTNENKPAPVTLAELDAFTLAYIAAALWSSYDNADENGGEPLDANYSAEDIALETPAQIAADCARFQAENAEDISSGCNRSSEEFTDTERAGHDFWLTRNGHGAGFWDGDWQGNEVSRAVKCGPFTVDNAGDRLTAASKVFGQTDLYIGDDGKIYA